MNGQQERPDEGAESIETQADPHTEDAAPEGGPQDNERPTDESPAEAEADALIEELQAKADENWDRYLRAAAEVENVRKRATRDVEHARKYALESFAKEMLAVRDSFEMGISAADSADAEALVAGNQATLKLLTTALERFGISEVDPIGEPFDPELHEAMTMQPSADAEPGSVLTVVQKGYALNGRLLRPAMVVVAAEAAGTGGESGSQD